MAARAACTEWAGAAGPEVGGDEAELMGVWVAVGVGEGEGRVVWGVMMGGGEGVGDRPPLLVRLVKSRAWREQ